MTGVETVVEDDVLAGGDETGAIARPDSNEVEIFKRKANRLENIPLSLIDVSDVSLRGVQRQTEEFQHLVDSIRNRGVLNSILVREQVNASGVKRYSLIDGLQRFTAAGDAGLVEIPANVVNLDDAEVLEVQLIANLNRITTKPADQCKQLYRMMARNVYMTKSQLAERVNQSVAWIDQRLSLKNLHPDAIPLVNEGVIHLSNAFALTKLPTDYQAEFIEAAKTEPPKTFIPRMKNRAKEIKDAKKTGADVGATGFQPVQHLQKPAAIKAELENNIVGIQLLSEAGLSGDAMAAWKLAIAWVLHFDPASQAEQKRAHEVREAEKAAERERIKAEKEKEKAAKIAKDAESIEKW